MAYRAAAGIVAALVIAAGIVLGLVGHSVPDATALAYQGKTVSCGSAFSPKDMTLDQSSAALGAAISGDATTVDYQSECSDALSTPRVFAWVLIAVGGVVGLFLLLVAIIQQPGAAPATQEAPARHEGEREQLS